MTTIWSCWKCIGGEEEVEMRQTVYRESWSSDDENGAASEALTER